MSAEMHLLDAHLNLGAPSPAERAKRSVSRQPRPRRAHPAAASSRPAGPRFAQSAHISSPFCPRSGPDAGQSNPASPPAVQQRNQRPPVSQDLQDVHATSLGAGKNGRALTAFRPCLTVLARLRTTLRRLAEFHLDGPRERPGDFLQGRVNAQILPQCGVGRLVGVVDQADVWQLGLLPENCAVPVHS